jgi:hypothetical protein
MRQVKVELVQVDKLSGDKLFEYETVIDVDDYGPDDLPEYFIENLEEFRSTAAKAVASRFVDYDSFGSDSAYLDRIDEIASTLYLSDVSVPNAVRRAYDIEGIYCGDGGIWGDVEYGSCLGEAKFAGLWTMSTNSGYDLHELIAQGLSPDKVVEDLQGSMDSQELTGMCVPRRPGGEEAEVFLRELLKIAEGGNAAELRQAVVDGASEFIAKRNERISDEIVLISEEEAAPSVSM